MQFSQLLFLAVQCTAFSYSNQPVGMLDKRNDTELRCSFSNSKWRTWGRSFNRLQRALSRDKGAYFIPF